MDRDIGVSVDHRKQYTRYLYRLMGPFRVHTRNQPILVWANASSAENSKSSSPASFPRRLIERYIALAYIQTLQKRAGVEVKMALEGVVVIPCSDIL